MTDGGAREQYVQAVLALYRTVPGVLGRVRRADRDLAGRIHDDGVPLYAIRSAFVLAAGRRVKHNAFVTPLPPIRSLHYFLPVLREVLERPPGYRDIHQMLETLRNANPLP